jgi:hypothetical protein
VHIICIFGKTSRFLESGKYERFKIDAEVWQGKETLPMIVEKVLSVLD